MLSIRLFDHRNSSEKLGIAAIARLFVMTFQLTGKPLKIGGYKSTAGLMISSCLNRCGCCKYNMLSLGWSVEENTSECNEVL